MGLNNPNTVDALGTDKDTGVVVLSLLDSWDWGDVHRHLTTLQVKMNAYFKFIESGQIWESVPSGRGRQVAIDIVFRFPPPSEGSSFVQYAADVAKQIDVLVTSRVHHQT